MPASKEAARRGTGQTFGGIDDYGHTNSELEARARG